MNIAGYEFAIGIWDIISLLLPIGIIFVFLDFKRRHKTRMDRLELLYNNVTAEGDRPELECDKLIGIPDELLNDTVENHADKVL